MENMQRIFRFLLALTENNNREWFAEHKSEYDRVRVEHEAIVNRLIAKIGLFDSQVKGLEAKDCTFRIYRDTRFSYDKTPYKTHLGAYMAGMGGRKSPRSGYYLHLEAGGGSMVSGGVWCPDGKLLKVLRQTVHENVEEFQGILNKPSFKKLYPGLVGEKLKTVPSAFPRDVPHSELLKHKHYVIETPLADNFFYQEDWEERVVTMFYEMKPFHDFLNFTVDDFYFK